jgi:putative membrane protein
VPKPDRQAGHGEEAVVMMFWDGGWPFWEVALTWVGMIAFWGLLGWAIYALVTSATRRQGPGSGGEDARQILDQRLARGEIDTEEYQRLRDVIAGRGDPSHSSARSGS